MRRAGAVSTAARASTGSGVSLATRVGSVALANPVMTASGTAGHGDELARYVDLASLGAVVVKSLSAAPWPGNPAPRVHETQGGMLNSVGLQGPGIDAWRRDELPPLIATGATVVASIWGRTVDEYRDAAERLAGAPPQVVAVEVNLSCPNLHHGRAMFAQLPETAAEAVEATAACGRPRWAKLTPMVADLVPIAAAARDAGAEAVTLVNTAPGLAIDTDSRRFRLGGGGGGLSGPAIHPIAVRAVHDVHAALPDLAIVGVGGVTRGVDAVELMMAGAAAVQVGTATFADPRSVARVAADVESWCRRHGVADVTELIGAARAR
jgi:dihydroorotate dehydrogenase (NAD+) catalytic subunit